MNTTRFAKAMEELGQSVSELVGHDVELELHVQQDVLDAFFNVFRIPGQEKYELTSYVVKGAEIKLKGK
jgi:hypothetical protein